MQATDSQVGWHLVGSYLPTTQAAATDPRVTTFWEDDLAGKMLKTAYDQLLEVDPDKPGPSIGPYPQYDEAVRSPSSRWPSTGRHPTTPSPRPRRRSRPPSTQYIEDNAPN